MYEALDSSKTWKKKEKLKWEKSNYTYQQSALDHDPPPRPSDKFRQPQIRTFSARLALGQLDRRDQSNIDQTCVHQPYQAQYNF